MFADTLLAVWEGHRPEMLERVAVIERAVTALITGDLDAELLGEARSAAHTLAGSAGTFGYVRASQLAREIESELQDAGVASVPGISKLTLSLRGELEADTGMLVASSPVVDTREDRMRMLLFSAQHELCARVATEAQARDIDLSTTGSVQEARALCEARHPGIVLLDLTLPASDVQSAYTLLSTDPASDGAGSIPVLALADGKAFAERVEVARQGGQDALLAIGGAAVAPVAECLTQPGTANVHAILRVAVALSDRWLLAGALAYGDSPDPAIRALVAELAGAVGGGQATEVLLQMLSDQAPVVRAAAAQGLGRLEYWPAGRALRLALTDSAWVVRQRAALTLRAFGAPGVLLFCGALEDPDRFAREMARQVLDLPDTAGSA